MHTVLVEYWYDRKMKGRELLMICHVYAEDLLDGQFYQYIV